MTVGRGLGMAVGGNGVAVTDTVGEGKVCADGKTGSWSGRTKGKSCLNALGKIKKASANMLTHANKAANREIKTALLDFFLCGVGSSFCSGFRAAGAETGGAEVARLSAADGIMDLGSAA